MKFSEAIRGLEGICGAEVADDPEIVRVCEDSRKVRAGDLFVARAGTKVSGGEYVREAVAKGAVAVVGEMQNAEWRMQNDGVAWARVKDANLAGAVLAHRVAGEPTRGMTMIAVTGTKGKTTVAYLLRSVLQAAGKKVGMVGTVEIDDGGKVVPAEMTTPGATELVEMFCRMRDNGVTHCVMEVSSHALHQHRVAGIDWAVAIFTNLTGDHLDYHKTMEEYAAAKALLFEGLKEGAVAVVNADDKWVGRMVQECKAKVVKYRLGKENVEHYLSNGKEAGQCLGSIIDMTGGGMNLWVWGADGVDYRIPTPLVGRHNAYNVLSVAAAADSIGIEWMTVVDSLAECSGAPGRLQAVVPPGMKRENMPFQVFVDYAHTHDALENVLTALKTVNLEPSKYPFGLFEPEPEKRAPRKR